ncbi:MAG: DoxX family protein [Nitrospinota bacterium]
MWLDSVLGPLDALGPFFIRLALAWVYIVHGRAKLFTQRPGVRRFSLRLESLGVPFPLFFALAAGATEFFGGIALLVGIATRWAALLLSVHMAVAIWKVAYKKGFTRGAEEAGYEFCVVLLAGSLALLVTGPGPISLEGILGLP